MRALRFDKTGSLDELKVSSVPRPIAAEGEVLIQVKAAAINPSDIKIVKLSFEETGAILRELSSGLAKGIYPSPSKEEPIQLFPLEQGVQVYRDLAEGRIRQKAVLAP